MKDVYTSMTIAGEGFGRVWKSHCIRVKIEQGRSLRYEPNTCLHAYTMHWRSTKEDHLFLSQGVKA